MAKSVAVIGAGVSGLLSAKAAKQAGLLPIVFETSFEIGGIWSKSSKHVPQTLTTNVSKYVCTFSDYPWETDSSKPPVRLFPTATEVGQYLQGYAKHFLSEPNCIRTNTKVTHVNFDSERGQWHVEYETAQGGSINHALPPRSGEEYFDFLVIASGFFSKPFIPSIPGVSSNACPVYHYSQAEILLSQGLLDLTRKSVVIVGGSLSGIELAGQLYRHSPRRVIHVTKKAFWIFPSLIPEDPSSVCPAFVPIDLALMAKFHKKDSSATKVDIDNVEPKPILTTTEINLQRNAQIKRFCGSQSRISPVLEVKDEETSFIGISDTYAELVRNGDIEVIRGELIEIDGLNLRIEQKNENGKSNELKIPHENTVVIFATGFSTQLPFFTKETLEAIDFDEKDLFLPLLLGCGILHPKLPNAAFVGMYRGPYFTTIELQARFAASVFSGSLPWPAVDDQLKDIQREMGIRQRFPRQQFPQPIYTESVQFHANLLKTFERPEEEYAFASKYSPSPEATAILQNFHSDLQAMRNGKYVPAVVFRNLAGCWEFRELLSVDSVPEPVVRQGIARFSPRMREREAGHYKSYVYSEDNLDALETIEYDDTLETLSFTENNVCRRMTFVLALKCGWRGTLVTEHENIDNDCTKATKISKFLFPFEGIYFSHFTRIDIGPKGRSEIKYKRPPPESTAQASSLYSFNSCLRSNCDH